MLFNTIVLEFQRGNILVCVNYQLLYLYIYVAAGLLKADFPMSMMLIPHIQGETNLAIVGGNSYVLQNITAIDSSNPGRNIILYYVYCHSQLRKREKAKSHNHHTLFAIIQYFKHITKKYQMG